MSRYGSQRRRSAAGSQQSCSRSRHSRPESGLARRLPRSVLAALVALACGGRAIASERDEVVGSDTREKPHGGEAPYVDREATEKPAKQRGVPLGPLTLSGNLSQRYRYRESGNASDQDVYGYFNLDAVYPGDRTRGVPFGKLELNLQGSYNLDVDGFDTAAEASRGTSFFPFTDATNTFGDRFRGFVHSAYLELTEVAAFERLRVGRQTRHVEETFLFDGGSLRTKRWKTLSFEAYGGVPTHLYESSSSGDALTGFGVESRVKPNLTIGADYLYVRDTHDQTRDTEEHLYRLRGRYNLDREWTLNAAASWVDSRDRRQQLELRYLSEAWGLLAQLRVLRQNGVVGFQSNELSPYLFVQGRYAPFYQYRLDIHQPIGESFEISGGIHLRHLEDSTDESLYNHDFRNYYVALETSDLWQSATASLQLDVWDSDSDDVYAASFEIEQKVGELLRARLGTSYSLYRVDLVTGAERERDRVYYVKLRWRLTSRLTADTDYQYERDANTEYHTVTTGLRLWF